jgi:hypothetical protein
LRDVTLAVDFDQGRIVNEHVTWRAVPGLGPSGAAQLRLRVVDALRSAALRRCARCRGLFATVRIRRGKPTRYCSVACAQTDRTKRWRSQNRELFRKRRRQAYKRRKERELGRPVKIQTRRSLRGT